MIGSKIDRYIIQKELGRGGMGVVYQAWDTKLECTVALKSVTPAFAHDEQARLRILREARTAAALNHPYICKIFDTVEQSSRIYVVMECCEGKTLERAELGIRKAIAVGIEIAEALEEAHAKGIIHRDLKPANVMLARSGHIKIMDFGLAKTLEKATSTPSFHGVESSATVSAEGQLVGTTPYMSPEQLRREDLDFRSDIFSFGVLLYELLTGQRPFYGKTAADTVASILSDEPEPMARYRRGIPQNLENAVRKMVAKHRDSRHQSAAQVRSDLSELLNEESLSQAVSHTSWSKKWLVASTLIILALVSLFAFRFFFKDQTGERRASETEAYPSSAENLEFFNKALRVSAGLSHSDNEQAIRLLEECVRRQPDYAPAHSALALEKLKRFWWYQGSPQLIDEALRHASHARQLDPGWVQAGVVSSIARTLQSSDPQPYLDLARILNERPDQSEATAWLSHFFIKAGDFDLAHELINRLNRMYPGTPYAGSMQALLATRQHAFVLARKQIRDLEFKFPNWDGIPSARAQRAIELQDVNLLQQAIDELVLLNPVDPSIIFWRSYVKSKPGSKLEQADLDTIRPHLEDYEFAALYAQICARQKDTEEALRWLEQSVEKGNYDIVQMRHPDFESLKDDPRFEELKRSLHDKISKMTVEMKPLILKPKK
jgi:serine/threonine protein kinase